MVNPLVKGANLLQAAQSPAPSALARDALAPNALAADSRSLDQLRREANADPRAAVKKAATQFEALFMQMVLKSMRDAMPKSGLLGDDSAQQMYTGMLDQQLATKMAASGTGLADIIAKQLTRHMAPPKADGAEATPTAPAAPAAPDAMPSRPSVAPRGTVVAPAASAPGGYGAAGPTPAGPTPAGPTSAVLAAAATTPAGSTPAPSSPAAGAEAAAATPSAGARDTMQQFVNRHWDHALAAQRATGIPARFVVAQAAHESGWGRHEIRSADGQPSHNLFGIKAGASWQGRTVDVVTTEYENGVAKKVVEKFRAYNNYSEAFRDWARLLANNPRYAPAVAAGADANAFASALQRGGYATDPAYGDKLRRAIGAVGSLRGIA